MKYLTRHIMEVVLITLFVSALISVMPAKDKMTPEELVANHLKSIGPADQVAARKTCVAEGDGTLRILTGGSGQLAGPVVLSSEGDKVGFSITFPFKDYPGDQFAFDGQKVETGFVQPGQRTRLELFFYNYNAPVREGLIGGVLSTAWPLANLQHRNAKLRYDGLKKIEGRELHELRYSPKKGAGDVNIFLYFDPQTYRHVESIYRMMIPAQIGLGGPNTSAQQQEVRLMVEEKFGDFKEVNGLTLPLHWNIHFTMEGEKSWMAEWDMNLSKITLNQPVDPKAFSLQ